MLMLMLMLEKVKNKKDKGGIYTQFCLLSPVCKKTYCDEVARFSTPPSPCRATRRQLVAVPLSKRRLQEPRQGMPSKSPLDKHTDLGATTVQAQHLWFEVAS